MMRFDLEEKIDEFYEKGYCTLENIIPEDYLKIAREEVILLDLWRWDNNIEGTKDFGNGIWWKGFDMATKFSPKLESLYKSKFMWELATSFHDSEDIYFYNDEIVTKYPKEGCSFFLHTDNEFSPDPISAEQGEYRMINFYWIMDDVHEHGGEINFQHIDAERPTEENYYLSSKDEIPPGDNWEWLYPKAGDIVVFDGNCFHYSIANSTERVRRHWANQYTSKPVGHRPYNNVKHPNPNYKYFYSDKFEKPE